MRYMNHWDIEEAGARYHGHPLLGPATETLANLAEWTDRNSDGWAYWPKPCRAAGRLMALIHTYDDAGEVTAADVADYRAALRPIKAFRTRQGADFQIVEVAP